MSLTQMHTDYLLHNYARTEINFVSGESATLKTAEGKEYIDFGSGIGVVSVGHGNPELAKTIAQQAANIIHISNLYQIAPQAELAKRLVEMSGYDMRMFFASSGAEINEAAIKIARKYGEKNQEMDRYKIVTLNNSFHGRTISALKATGQPKMHTPVFGPYPDGFLYAQDIDDVMNVVDDKTVAVMIELVQGEGGVTPLDKAKVQAMASALKARDILLIVDEVQTGIFRTGELLASNVYGIEPDVITLAKGLGGGVPIGALMTRLKDIFSAGDHGSTFGGNYLATTTAMKVLEILEDAKKSGALDQTIADFTREMDDLLARYPEYFSAHYGVGLMRALEVKESEMLPIMLKKALEKGVLVLRAGTNRMRFLPPLTITKAEMELGFERLKDALDSL